MMQNTAKQTQPSSVASYHRPATLG